MKSNMCAVASGTDYDEKWSYNLDSEKYWSIISSSFDECCSGESNTQIMINLPDEPCCTGSDL